ncbi:peroxisomal NADH pyrophosphatase NUDT12 [Phyllopteryx taeniolatus]|uniref:peroxisomal NADH pyrophosphatase NUDT12 n=1 Tax=Phyllopteryx taeniolatus TaxID=161469 RepID=UPI002AD2452F|nr:peroxisomal NADH pyrophosphatase NUDT12 [Phyllopteryx taeniolatus]XP_061625161.1 peroxisomal NADH pyrophosphatase NUDT12 [Phyllopteryx taeniolatus]
MSGTGEEEVVEKFLDAASHGDEGQVTSLLSAVPSLLERTGPRGWTALMLAARNGHQNVVQTLLQHGCDRSLVNTVGQSASDVAKFWGHEHVAILLGDLDEEGDGVGCENYFGCEPLDRLSAKRTDSVWLEDRKEHPSSVFLLFSNLSPMLYQNQEGVQHLCRMGYEAVQDLVEKPDAALVFLGVERRSRTRSASEELPAWFAISSDEDGAALLGRCLHTKRKCSFASSAHRDLLNLSDEDAGILAPARALLAWHRRYAFCSTCGSATVSGEGGHKRSCRNQQCPSNKGVHNTCYPRTDPVVIMLVVHPDGNQCLLGRKSVFPARMFSCLAGFVEPGETLEAAARREVCEESGVRVGAVRYVSCQPWPMPSQLMIGCLCVAVTTDISVDRNEIEEARWFPRQQVMEALLGGGSRPGPAHSGLIIPPKQTIAHQLLRHWISTGANL